MVVRDGRVLFGKRKNAHGDGTWSFPGGHLEFGESLLECAKREVLEETGLEVKNVAPFTFTNDIFEKEGKHYITLFVRAECGAGEPKVLEPTKCEEWQWCKWDALPEPLFIPIQNLLKQGIHI